MAIKDEVIDELLGSREIKTQDDLFGQRWNPKTVI